MPGVAEWKPSACPLCGAGCGVLVRVMEGDAEVLRDGQRGVMQMGLGQEARRQPGASDQPGRALRARAGGDSGHLSSRIASRTRSSGPATAAAGSSAR